MRIGSTAQRCQMIVPCPERLLAGSHSTHMAATGSQVHEGDRIAVMPPTPAAASAASASSCVPLPLLPPRHRRRPAPPPLRPAALPLAWQNTPAGRARFVARGGRHARRTATDRAVSMPQSKLKPNMWPASWHPECRALSYGTSCPAGSPPWARAGAQRLRPCRRIGPTLVMPLSTSASSGSYFSSCCPTRPSISCTSSMSYLRSSHRGRPRHG